MVPAVKSGIFRAEVRIPYRERANPSGKCERRTLCLRVNERHGSRAMTHHIVFLDRATLDASLRAPRFDHTWEEHPATDAESAEPRLRSATIAITNKVPLRREVLQKLPQLELIAMAATGYDVVDVQHCKTAG